MKMPVTFWMISVALSAGAFAPSSAHAAANLLITEAMPDPTGTDVDREWIEIYNAGSTAVDLTGYAVGDGTVSTNTSAGEGMGVFPDGTIMQAGQVYIIAARATGFNASWIQGTFPNAKADFEFANGNAAGESTIADDPNTPNLTQKANWGVSTATLAMANGGDDLEILDPSNNVVDYVSYGTAVTNTVGNWVDVANATIQRIGYGNTSADWAYVTGLGNATPGTVNIVPEPASLSLLAIPAVSMMIRRRARRV